MKVGVLRYDRKAIPLYPFPDGSVIGFSQADYFDWSRTGIQVVNL